METTNGGDSTGRDRAGIRPSDDDDLFALDLMPPGPQELIWNECARCHRQNTVEDASEVGGDEKHWICRRCGAVTPHSEAYAYQDGVMTDTVFMPDCPPTVLSAMSAGAELLLSHARGEEMGQDAAGNMGRWLVRMLAAYGVKDERFRSADE